MTMWYWALAIELHMLHSVIGGSELLEDVTDPFLAEDVEVTPFLVFFLKKKFKCYFKLKDLSILYMPDHRLNIPPELGN